MSSFDSSSWRRLYKLIRPFFFGDLRWKARALVGLLIGLSVSIKGFDVVMSYIGRDFMTALSLREQSEFLHNLYLYLGAFCIAIPLIVFHRYTEERTALLWRRWLSQYIIDKYFANRAFYRMAWHKVIDNPDQRIEEDIRTFTSTSLSLFLIFLQSFIALVAFAKVLSSISWLLTATAIGYSIIGSIATYLLGRPLIHLNFEQLRLDADYRYKLIKVRDSAEAIALYRGEHKERTRVRQKLKLALRNMLRIINRYRTLNFFTTGYNYVLIVLPTVVVAPLYLDGQIEFGVVTQATVAFGYVLNALSIIVTNFGSLSSYAAVVKRLGTFAEVLEETSHTTHIADEHITEVDKKQIVFENVTVATPDNSRVLIKDLNYTINKGGLLVCGASGCGKTSLIRVLTGLWPAESGRIIRPPANKIIVVPQRPYLVIGTLRSQLLYGQSNKGITDKELLKILEEAELGTMFERVGGFEAQVDWGSTLSNGEQQRIGLARALLAKPSILILDEATTAIEESAEASFYTKIQQFAEIYISVGYRTTLSKFHHSILEIGANGMWKVEEVEQK